MREPNLRTLRGGGGDGGIPAATPSQPPQSGQRDTEAPAKVRPLQQLTTQPLRELVGRRESQLGQEGELSEAPPPAVADTRRDWPMLLLQALRGNRWVVAQVKLIGKVECDSPSPIRVLEIGGRYEITNREYDAALQISGPQATQTIRACLLRESTWSQQGTEYVQTIPTYNEYELKLFERLWRVLAEHGWIARLNPTSEAPTE